MKKSFGESDGYIRGRLRSFEAKRRNLKILVFEIHPAEFARMGLVSLSSMRGVLCTGRQENLELPFSLDDDINFNKIVNNS